MYTVKEVAKLLDLTEHTIRYYTDKSLVPHLQRDIHNNRIFNDEAVSWLLAVKHLRHCGMSIEDIKRYIDLCLQGESTITKRYQIMLKQRDIALQQLEEARQRAKYMEDKAKHYFDYMNGETTEDVNVWRWMYKNKNQ